MSLLIFGLLWAGCLLGPMGAAAAQHSHSPDFDQYGSYEPAPPSRLDKMVGIAAGPVVGLIFLFAFGVFAYMLRGRKERPSPATTDYESGVDVTVISIAFDSRARAFAERRLAAMPQVGPAATAEEFVALCGQMIKLLKDVQGAWLYVGAKNYPPMGVNAATEAFQACVADYGTRCGSENPNAQGYRARAGQGVVVVTLVLAARTELLDLRDVRDAGEIQLALSALGMLGPEQLESFDVIWAPAGEGGSMGVNEVESTYPELGKVDESIRTATVFCRSCAGPFARALRQCPHCNTSM